VRCRDGSALGLAHDEPEQGAVRAKLQKGPFPQAVHQTIPRTVRVFGVPYVAQVLEEGRIVVAAVSGLLLGGRELGPAIAYVAGSVGTLVGADLLRLKDIRRLGSTAVSIGGAGTFDGIFLNGVLAALLA
jgi:uncharacterized membrane protein